MKIHIVKKGDTLYELAQKYNVELESLIAFNPQIADPNVIDVGMKVKIPEPAKPVQPPTDTLYKHVVQQGDTLWKLGKAWGIPLASMIAANPQLKNPNVLMTGEIVNIPKLSHGHDHDGAHAGSEGAANAEAHGGAHESNMMPMPNVGVGAMPNASMPVMPIENQAPVVSGQETAPVMPNANMPAQPNFTMPMENQAPSYTMPMENQAPSYTMPMENQTPSFTMPMENQAPSFMMPMENQAPSYTMPMENQAPSYTMPIENQMPSFTMPMENQMPSFTMPMENQMPNFAMPIEHHMPKAVHPYEQFNIQAVEVNVKEQPENMFPTSVMGASTSPYPGLGNDMMWQMPQMPVVPCMSDGISPFGGYPAPMFGPMNAPLTAPLTTSMNAPLTAPMTAFPMPNAALPVMTGGDCGCGCGGAGKALAQAEHAGGPVPSHFPMYQQPFGFMPGPGLGQMPVYTAAAEQPGFYPGMPFPAYGAPAGFGGPGFAAPGHGDCGCGCGGKGKERDTSNDGSALVSNSAAESKSPLASKSSRSSKKPSAKATISSLLKRKANNRSSSYRTQADNVPWLSR